MLHPPRPALRVGDFDRAVQHYVDWLGFRLDWEWREAPGQPAIGFLSRDDCRFMINEHPDAPGPTSMHLDVSNLEALVEEWNDRQPGAAKVRKAPPYEFPEVVIADPWGNRLYFEGKDEAEEQQRRGVIRQRMKAYVDKELEAGRALPTPEALKNEIGPPLGTAIEVLNEYPEYGHVFESRRQSSDQRDDGTSDE